MRMMEVKTRKQQGQAGVKEDGECRACTACGQKAIRGGCNKTAGRGRVNGNQLTEALIMKTRQEMEDCLDCR